MRLSLLYLAIIAMSFVPGDSPRAQQPATPSSPRRPAPSIDIVPVVEHHQHVVGPAAIAFIAPGPALRPIKLPADLQQLLRKREHASGGDDISVYTSDAQILDVSDAEDHWVRGAEGLKRMVGAYEPNTPFTPTAYHTNGNSGYIAGVVGLKPESPTMHFMFGLKKDDSGAWRIAVEYATVKPALEFARPVTAEKTIQVLDDAGIKRAAVLSVAYWFGDGAFKGTAAEEYAKVREENDWMVAQINRFPERLVGFCGVNPLRDYAIDEIRRCSKLPGIKGMKVHFGNAHIDVTKSEQVEKLRRFFRTANDNRMAIVAHLWIRGRSYGPTHTRIFVKEILPEAPDVTVQIAHLGGAGRYAYDSVTQVFVDAIAAGDKNMKNVYFDMATVVTEAQSEATIATITNRLRQIGLERILFGADTPVGSRPDPILAWAMFRRRLPLTETELRIIAGNVAPYLR